MKRAIFSILFVLSVWPCPAAEQIGIVTASQGDVRVSREGRDISMDTGDSILAGDIVRTGKDSKAKILFQDDSLVVLGDRTTLEVKNLALDPAADARTTRLKLVAGKLRVVVEKLFGGALSAHEVETETAIAGVKGTHYLIWRLAELQTRLCVLEGRVSFRSAGSGRDEIWIEAGQGAFAAADHFERRECTDEELRSVEEATTLPDTLADKAGFAPEDVAEPVDPMDVVTEEPLFEEPPQAEPPIAPVMEPPRMEPRREPPPREIPEEPVGPPDEGGGPPMPTLPPATGEPPPTEPPPTEPPQTEPPQEEIP